MNKKDSALHGGNLRLAAEKYNHAPDKILDFSANINLKGYPREIKKIINNNLKKVIHYPDVENKKLIHALSDKLNIPHKNILIGNGSVELIYLIISALQPHKVLIPVPSFTEYERAAGLGRAKISFFPAQEKNGFKHDIQKMIPSLHGKDMMFLCNPNNPTGALYSKEELQCLLSACKKYKTILVLDEVFIDFIHKPEQITMISEAVENKALLVLRSFTKFFALPGLRIGYLAGHRDMIKKISAHQYPWSVNTLAQEAAKTVIFNSKYISSSREYLFKAREHFIKMLQDINGLKILNASANFIFCKVEHKKSNPRKLTGFLGRKGILIRDCSNFRGLNDKFIRIAVKKKKENKKLIKSLEEFFTSC